MSVDHDDGDEREEGGEHGPDGVGDTDVPPTAGLVDRPVEDPAAPTTDAAPTGDPGPTMDRAPNPEPSSPPSQAAGNGGPASEPRASRPPEEDEEGRRRQRRKLEGLLRESFRRAVEKGVEAGIGAIGTGVDKLEKGVEVSRDTMKQASSQLRGVVDEVKLPKEAANYLFGQIDETKNVLIRAVSREVRDFLAGTDIAHELQRALTSLSFEIRTEIRFVPNEKGVMKAEVKSRAVPHRSRREGEDED